MNTNEGWKSEKISFGTWLRKRRRTMDLTQKELADQAGCARITLNRIEAGTLRPSKELAWLLLEKLGISESERLQWIPFARGSSGFPAESLHPSIPGRPNNLPFFLTSFVGREKERGELIQLVDRFRLVTLTGTGGVGKTRLSIHVAADLLDRFPHGVWLTQLAPIQDPSLISGAIAQVLGLPAEAHRPTLEMLCDFLRTRELLIVLDDCEHLVAACAQTARRLLQAAPQLHILASSREAFGIDGEANYPISPLSAPDPRRIRRMETLGQYEAPRLFIERASAALPAFMVTDENAPTIAQICCHLDGIPLAIELAAAKLPALSIKQIAERLDDRFGLLADGRRTALERHQTLRAAVDWSYNLLAPEEQILLRRTSVFAGGWTLEAAESVCTDQSESLRSDQVLHHLEQLIHKSLVSMDEQHGESRYHMLETIRQYASGKLEEWGEGDRLRDKHLEYFSALASAAAGHMVRLEQREWLERLEAEYENLRSALEWSMSRERPEYALRLASALGPFWHLRCYWMEGSRWLGRALSISVKEPTATEKTVRARALYWDADLAQSLGDIERSKACAEASLALCKAGTDRRDLAIARFFVGFAYHRQGLSDLARSLVEESLTEFQELQEWFWAAVAQRWLLFMLAAKGEIPRSERVAKDLEAARRVGDHFTLAAAMMNQAKWAWEDSRPDKARAYLEEAEALSHQIGFQIREGEAFLLRGEMAHYDHDYPQAKKMYENCRLQQELLGETYERSFVLESLALLARDEGDMQKAGSYLEEALQVAMKIRDRGVIGFRLALRGQVRLLQGDMEAARRDFKDSLSVVIELDERHAQSNPLIIFCSAHAAVKPYVATRILGAIHAHYVDTAKEPMAPLRRRDFDSAVTRARQSLSESACQAAWVEGNSMTMEQAVQYALQEA